MKTYHALAWKSKTRKKEEKTRRTEQGVGQYAPSTPSNKQTDNRKGLHSGNWTRKKVLMNMRNASVDAFQTIKRFDNGCERFVYSERILYGSSGFHQIQELIRVLRDFHWFKFSVWRDRVAVISAKNHKRQRRKRQSVTAIREKSQTPKFLTAVPTLPNLTLLNLTWPNLTYTNFGVCDFSRLAVTDWRLRRWRFWFLVLSNAPREVQKPLFLAPLLKCLMFLVPYGERYKIQTFTEYSTVTRSFPSDMKGWIVSVRVAVWVQEGCDQRGPLGRTRAAPGTSTVRFRYGKMDQFTDVNCTFNGLKSEGGTDHIAEIPISKLTFVYDHRLWLHLDYSARVSWAKLVCGSSFHHDFVGVHQDLDSCSKCLSFPFF